MSKNSCSAREFKAYNAITAARRMGHSRDSAVVRRLVKRWEKIAKKCALR